MNLIEFSGLSQGTQLMVLLILAFIGVLAVWTSARARDAAGQPVGFGGWLFIYAVSQVLGTLIGLYDLAPTTADGIPNPLAHPLASRAIPIPSNWLSPAIEFAVVVIFCITTMVMFLRSRWIPAWNIAQSIAVWIELIVRFARVEVGYQPLAVATLWAAFLVYGAWISYFSRSVRVRNTFTR